MTVDLSTYLSRVPLFADVDPSSCARLGGLTNLNYLFRHGQTQYVMRIPGEGTSAYINRVHEEVAARSAAIVGVNAEVVFFDASDGLMVTRFVEGAITMDAETFRDLGAVQRAGRAFRQLHERATEFANDFTLFPMIDEYKSLLAAKGAILPDGYNDVQTIAGAARGALQRHPVALVPSHCDPLCENFLDTGDRMFLIDYEYAGNNDPMWDLGDLSVEGGFTDEQDDALLLAYFDGQPTDQDRARMVIYKALCDLLWTLWGVIQHTNNNPADDFWSYANIRFQRCRELLLSPYFAHQLTRLA